MSIGKPIGDKMSSKSVPRRAENFWPLVGWAGTHASAIGIHLGGLVPYLGISGPNGPRIQTVGFGSAFVITDMCRTLFLPPSRSRLGAWTILNILTQVLLFVMIRD